MPFLDGLLADLDRHTTRTRALCEPLSPDQLNWRPGPGRWSVAECLEHLVMSGDAYVPAIQPRLEYARTRGIETTDESRPRRSLMGYLLLRVVRPDNPKTAKAPRSITPKSGVAPDILERFTAANSRLADCIRNARGIDLGRVKLASPVNRIVRLNLADAFEVLVVHEERHLNQAERVTRAEGFPA